MIYTHKPTVVGNTFNLRNAWVPFFLAYGIPKSSRAEDFGCGDPRGTRDIWHGDVIKRKNHSCNWFSNRFEFHFESLMSRLCHFSFVFGGMIAEMAFLGWGK